MLKPFHSKTLIEAGCDEAGRGCIAGPVFAAAVVLPRGFSEPALNDSKQLTSGEREELRILVEQKALSWAVAQIDPRGIDRLNILNASICAMHAAVDQLSVKPELLLVDGNRFKPYRNIHHLCIVKGDTRYQAIAAASILAKTHRDEFMKRLDELFPVYGWKTNKGYPTRGHRAAVISTGITEHHRRSFAVLPEHGQMKLEFAE